MIRSLLTTALILASSLFANAIIYHYDNFNSTKKTCRLKSWSGSQPSSGILKIPAEYTHTDGKTYKVTSIANHALDDLTTVKEISISANIAKIGQADSDEGKIRYSSNFYNCGKLVKFIVDPANTVFEASAEGMLMIKGGEVLLNVPACVATNAGKITLSKEYAVICHDAFRGNTTVEILSIPTHCSVNANGGLNYAKKLKKFEVRGNDGWLTKAGGLLVNDGCRAVAWPPALPTDELKLSTSITHILDDAFANTSIPYIKLNSVETIYKGAFANSAIESMAFPGSLDHVAESAFENCAALQSMSFESVDLELPDHFARNCKSLKTVTSENPFLKIGESAFLNCSSLEEFPFSASTDMSSDSIFYGCGFHEVVFDDYRPLELYMIGRNFLSNCKNLERINASAIQASHDYCLGIGPDFAPNCPNLTELRLPEVFDFWQSVGESNPPAFGYSCNLRKIVMHTFFNGDLPQFGYSTTKGISQFAPNVFIAYTQYTDKKGSIESGWPVANLFMAGNGASVSPRFFCDTFNPSEYSANARGAYVDPKGSYYVPGGCTSNYEDASDAGCDIYEMYEIEFTHSGESMRISVSPNTLPSVGFKPVSFSVSFNDETPVTIGNAGYIDSKIKYNDISKVKLNYILDGVKMRTDYPSTFWRSDIPSGIDSAEADTPYFSLRDKTLSFAGADTDFSIYSTDGRLVMHGHGDTDLSSLPSGIYIMRINSDSNDSTKIRL